MVELDEEFRETHFALLERFYKLFGTPIIFQEPQTFSTDSVYKYYTDFKAYLDDLAEVRVASSSIASHHTRAGRLRATHCRGCRHSLAIAPALLCFELCCAELHCPWLDILYVCRLW